MLAQKDIPVEFLNWNQQYGAPFGRQIVLARKLKRLLPSSWYWKLRGPFSIQRNNTTRTFEYPWVFSQLHVREGMKVVDVGGGLGGFQFVLSKLGCQVINVDPGMEAAGRGWPCNQNMMEKLNRCFDTQVQLQNTTMDKAQLDPDSVDAVISISVIEHLPWNDVVAVIEKAWTILKPGGKFILTVDLFLDVEPFTEKTNNKYGSNINLKKLCSIKPFDITVADKSELYGFEQFDAEKIESQSENYLIGGGYPAMVQCLVLEKPNKKLESE